MKFTLKGWSKEGKLTIVATVLVACSYLAGMFTIMKTFSFESQVEAQAFLSYSSALAGCVQRGEMMAPGDKSDWDYCVRISNEIASETREILTKEPVKMYRKTE